MSSRFFHRALKLVYWTVTLQLPARVREKKAVAELRASGLFDVDYYLAQDPEVVESGLDAISHYVRLGAGEGRNPHPLFDTRYYLAQNPDVASAGINPLLHFVWAGARERRNPNPLFDTGYYLGHDPLLAESGANPLFHYVAEGAYSGRKPSALFDSAWYLAHHPEVAQLGINPLAHYLQQAATSCHSTEVEAQAQASADAPHRAASGPQPAGPPPRLIAFYLPQFHPIPENDEWWGQGFTEWTNVTQAKPLFPGHHQPRLPADLGFYDLRLTEVRERQAELARENGIYGFCYYYYWFEGRRVLERPLQEVLDSGAPDFPFCICWANENWTRRWDGLEDDILLAQSHTLESDYHFIQDAIPIFQDPRYIKIDGEPLLLIYRADKVDDPHETTALWRDACKQAGLPGLHLCAVQFRVDDPRPFGFDSAVEFPPHHFPAPACSPERFGADADFQGAILDYAAGAANSLRRTNPDYVLYRGLVPCWDNTARRGKHATVFVGSTPAVYERWLAGLFEAALHDGGPSSRFIFVNAWNEWAEGAYLEPDQRNGRTYLDATRRVVERFASDLVPAAEGETSRVAARTGGPEQPTTSPAKARARRPEARELQWKRAPGRPRKDATNRTPLLFVGHDAAAAGSQYVLLEVLEVLRARGEFEPYLVLLEGGDLMPRYEAVAHTLRIDEHERLGIPPEEALAEVARGLAAQGLETAFCNTVVSARAVRECKLAGLRVICLVHEQPDSIDRMFGGKDTMARIDRYADTIVTVSDFARSALRNHYDLAEGKLAMVHPPLRRLPEPSHSRRSARRELFGKKSANQAFCLILGCGTLYARKGPDIFVELARRVKQDPPATPCRFVWVGGALTHDGVEEHRRAAAAAGVSDILEFVGVQDDITPYFVAADLFTLTSREDPFPLVSMEAMSFGIPVVAFEGAGGAPELIGAKAGVVVPHLDLGAMAEAVIKLADDPQRRETLGEGAKRSVATDFTPERYAEQLLDLAKRGQAPDPRPREAD